MHKLTVNYNITNTAYKSTYVRTVIRNKLVILFVIHNIEMSALLPHLNF